jgi:hypothetical protein
MNLNEEVKPEVYFYLTDGGILKSISELAIALKNMNDAIYNHHVSAQRNDSANWTRDVYLRPEIADEISKAKNKKVMYKVISKLLVKEKKELEKQKKQIQEKTKELEKGVKIIDPPRKRSEVLKLLKV